MSNFWDFNVWGSILIFAALFGALLVANIIKKMIPFMRKSLIPTSVLAGLLLLATSAIYQSVSGGRIMFDEPAFNGSGMAFLEVITYHCLALGFIASAFKTSKNKMSKKRTVEIFNSGVTTVSTYLIQAVFGLGITLIVALVIPSFFGTAGVLLPFGFGQGSGQALNYGTIYQNDYGFTGGSSFGLAIAALGFLSASIGGVIHLNISKHRGRLKASDSEECAISSEEVQAANEIPMQESVDKLTIQIALIAFAYFITYLMMWGLGSLLPGMKSTIYGFNFLLGVISATLIKLTLKFLRKKNVVKKEYTNNFLLTRTSNFFFDIMVVAGIAAIQIETLKTYWGVLLILGAVGMAVTFIYTRLVSKALFKDYAEEQFLATYGMLTGTASTGIILLREVDRDFKTPAADNLVYQNFPAIVFGFPLMLLANWAPKQPYWCLLVFVVFFAVMNIILFRGKIFRLDKNRTTSEHDEDAEETTPVEQDHKE
ncbi:MAG: hypothetical protein E7585_01925 [Ruminococcaceae bacterium]|nr:hypothetical protein [Oscillospiraceae bacterium]